MISDEIIAKLMEQVSVDKENTKVYIIAPARSGGKTLVQQQIADQIRNKTGLTVLLIDSKEEVSVSEQEKAIVFENLPEPSLEDFQKINQELVEYMRAPASAREVVKSTILRHNKMERDQMRFRKRQQRKSTWK